MCKEKNIEDFFEGNESANETYKKLNEKSDVKSFLEVYQMIIDDDNKIRDADFDPFAKIQRVPKRIFLKRYFPYAAAVLVLVVVGWLVQQKENSTYKQSLSKQEIIKLNKDASYALGLFSSELNDCLKEIEKTKYLSEPLNRVIHIKTD